MDIKKSLKDVVVLLVICSVFAVVLAAVNSVTAPIIADRLAAAASLSAIIGATKEFTPARATPNTAQIITRTITSFADFLKFMLFYLSFPKLWALSTFQHKERECS